MICTIIISLLTIALIVVFGLYLLERANADQYRKQHDYTYGVIVDLRDKIAILKKQIHAKQKGK